MEIGEYFLNDKCVCKFKKQISIKSYPLYKKEGDTRKYVCSFMQKKYGKDKLKNKENGYLQGMSGEEIERRVELSKDENGNDTSQYIFISSESQRTTVTVTFHVVPNKQFLYVSGIKMEYKQ